MLNEDTKIVSFLGIPVEMDRRDSGRRTAVKQLTKEEFANVLRPVLDAGYIVHWNQFTPYFNDGDICEFNVNHPGILKFDPSIDYADGDTDMSDEDNLIYAYGNELDKDTKYLLERLSQEMGGGHCDDILYETFGDHAEIIVTPTKITKVYYEHD